MPVFTAGASLSLLLVAIKAVLVPKTDSTMSPLNLINMCVFVKRQTTVFF